MITVIDSPCGYGKTTYAIDMINNTWWLWNNGMVRK